MNILQTQRQTSTKRSRPLTVTLLGIGVLLIAGINGVRLFQAARQWNFLASLPSVSPLYIALSGLLWFLAALLLSWGLLSGKSWAPTAARVFALLYSLYYWIDQLVVARAGQNPAHPPAWPFDLGANLFLLLFTLIILIRPAAKAFFGEVHGK